MQKLWLTPVDGIEKKIVLDNTWLSDTGKQ
jgi:hypothetical protein